MAELVLTFETHPGRTLTLALFRDVKNAKEVRATIADASKPEFAYMNASLIVDPFVVQLAAQRALAAESAGRLVTKSLHTELLYGISGTKHVVESLKRFGIADDTTTLLLARFDCQPEELAAAQSLIAGVQVPLCELPSLTDTELVDKCYKITPAELQGGRSRTDAVVFRIGAKDCL
ncbi:hypothetical protein Agub_g367 [Astrephomene gubernaculifera]|uniref:EKC/KEOPS complex subunit cgi121 n=1 Tax=Astrephomene gubernaculifera TaxID=47775 RepID=A0AAD3DGC1_9CHLO|nr:hypothetical protein Agub_g367 [Astrephomene gubernaculifera]